MNRQSQECDDGHRKFRYYDRSRILCFTLAVIAVAPVFAQSPDTRIQPGHILEADHVSRSLIGMQYENYFTPNNAGSVPGLSGSWTTEEAVPILGKYDSFNVDVIKKHAQWFNYLGIDWILIDWTNMLWMTPPWEAHSGGTKELEETAELFIKTYAEMDREGKPVPRLVFMLSPGNGALAPDGFARTNTIIAYLKSHYFDRPEYKNLWLYYGGKPLLTLLHYVPHGQCEAVQKGESSIVAPGLTIRWMGTQLQDNPGGSCGMWSWMDGTVRQMVTRRDGKAEETVVTPASFLMRDGPTLGWSDASATGRDHGAPYIESWKVAFENHPKFIQIHQWNEFAGQKDSEGAGPNHDFFGDEYNLEFSDDLEPTQPDAVTYRGRGGWGYYYLNLTKALISLYRGETPGITVMALSGPSSPAVVKEDKLPLSWTAVGAAPTGFTLKLDGALVASGVHTEDYTLDLSGIAAGEHRVELTADGAYTYFDLAPEHLTERSKERLPVTSSIEFTIAADRR
jgi:hypothetical protein